MKRLPAFRFSLRTLFVAVTFAAVAAWWWQRPYTKETSLGEGCGTHHPSTSIADYKNSFLSAPRKHGLEKVYANPTREKSFLAATSHWVDGKLHGLYQGYDKHGRVQYQGEYIRGEKHGVWTFHNEVRLLGKTHYEFGKLQRHSSYGLIEHGEEAVSMREYNVDEEAQYDEYSIVGREFPRTRVTLRDFPDPDERGYRHTKKHGMVSIITLKHGPVESRRRDGSMQYEGEYRKDVPNGEWKFWESSGKLAKTFLFSDGVLKEENGQKIDDKRIPVFSHRRLDNWLERSDLAELTVCEFNDVHIVEALASLRLRNKSTQFRLREKALAQKGMPSFISVRCEWRDIPQAIAFYMMADSVGLRYVHRPGIYWFTTPEDCATWKDRVRIDESVTSMGSKSPLMQTLNSWTELEFLDTPLNECVEFLTLRHRIDIQLSPNLVDVAIQRGLRSPTSGAGQTEKIEVGSDFVVNAELRYIPLRSALEILLEDLDLVCNVTSKGLEISAPP